MIYICSGLTTSVLSLGCIWMLGVFIVIHERGISDYNDKYDTIEIQVIDSFD